MSVDSRLEAVVRRDRRVVIAALAAVIALSWAYLLAGAGMGMSALDMTRMAQLGESGRIAAMPMMTPAEWTPGYTALMFAMWWIMMLAMMLPSVAPVVLLFAAVNRKQRETGHPSVATTAFALGYLAAWAGFSGIAVTLQRAFEYTNLLSPALVGTNAVFAGVLLLAAGLYQLTPMKHACLVHCQAPHAFLGTHWRRGTGGAIRMGLEHGAYCVGCCWFLMGLLFVGGVMNLYWIIGLALFVFVEKVVVAGRWLGHATGIVLSVWGITTLVFAL